MKIEGDHAVLTAEHCLAARFYQNVRCALQLNAAAADASADAVLHNAAAAAIVVVRRLASRGPRPAGICQHRHRFLDQN